MATTPITELPVLVGFEDATPLLSDPAALRDQADRDGYLFFKKLLPADVVLDLRRQLLGVLDEFGWLQKEPGPALGLADPVAVAGLEGWGGTGVTQAAYLATQKIELFHRLPHHPKLLRMYEALFGKAVLPHPRNIARLDAIKAATNALREFTRQHSRGRRRGKLHHGWKVDV